MTSEERRHLRYHRRCEKRKKKLELENEEIGDLDKVFTFHDMFKCGKDCCSNVRWKQSVQNFELHIFSRTAKTIRDIKKHKWKSTKYFRFKLRERGKIRDIDAPKIADRQVHKVLTRKVLLPIYTKRMIYNNGASLKNKGYDFTKRQLRNDLKEWYKENGRDGYIITIDFHHFFPSVHHELVKENHTKYFLNDDVRYILDYIVDFSEGETGLPLGIETSQAEMIFFPSPLDNYMKCQLCLLHFGHYMDDYYIITKEPYKVIDKFRILANNLKLTMNESKTKINSLSKPFKFCKTKYILLNDGRLITRGNRDSLKILRRKIKSLYGKLSLIEYYSMLQCSIHYFEKHNNHKNVLELNRLIYRTTEKTMKEIKNEVYIT